MTTMSTHQDPLRAQWEQAAAGVLRKARRLSADADDVAAWSALTTASVEGVPIPPLGTADRTPAPLPGVRDGRRGTTGWDVRTILSGQDPLRVADDALAELENGATSLILTVGGPGIAPADITTALNEVYLDMAPVVLSIDGDADELDAAAALLGHIAAQGVSAAVGTNLGADPIGRCLRVGTDPDPAAIEALVARLADLATGAGVRALVVDATAAHDLGAAEVAELGYSLAVGAAYLRALAAAGIELDRSAELIEFRYAATADQFLTMAKFRAARALWRRVLELSGAPADRRAQHQHAVSSRPMMTRYDPWVNLLRGTVAAFAAGVGGADAVTVVPFDAPLGVPDALGRRLARNTSALLISESHVAQVDDPAGGAFAIELLTGELADGGWAEFQRIEAAGGIYATFTDRTLPAAFSETAAERQRRVADRRVPITGVTEFPNLGEVLLLREPQQGPAPTGWAAEFESLRDEPMVEPVFLATLGPVAGHNVRAMFASNAFAAGGIPVDRAGPTSGVDDVLAAYERSGRSVVCLAGTDASYQGWGPGLVSALRAAGATWIISAGRPPAELAPLIDDQLVQGQDLLGLLRRTRAQLQQEGVSR